MPRELLSARDFPDDLRGLLSRNLARCEERVANAARRAIRAREDVRVVVVSKYVDEGVTRILWELGVRDFGENRVQDGLRKRNALAGLDGARVHFIGHLQRNKARRALEAFDSIHSLDSIRLAEELESRLGSEDFLALGREAPDIFIEVNVSEEERKTGLAIDDLPVLLDHVEELPRVKRALVGLMGMAPHDEDPERARPVFRRLRELRDAMAARGSLQPDAGLSMGMSGDFEVAIEEGATVVRVGSLVFEAGP